MATYVSGSGAGAELFALVPMAAAYIAEDEGPGSLNGMSAVSKMDVGSDTTAVISYFLEDTLVDKGQSDGRRGRGLKFQDAEGGRLQTRPVVLDDLGKKVTLDHLDSTLSGRDRDALGVERAAAKTKTLFERRLGAELTVTATPWGVADQVESALWSTATTDIIGDLIAAKQAYRAAQDLLVPRLEGIHFGENVWEAMLQNTAMVSVYGGNLGAGALREDMVLAALRNLGFRHITIGSHGVYGGTVTLYSFAGPDSDPRVKPSGINWAQQGTGTGDNVVLTVEEIEHGVMWEYLARMTGELILIPELGLRFADVLS